MRVLLIGLTIATAIAVTGCSRRVTPTNIDKIDASYAISGGSFETGQTIYVATKAIDRGGIVEVCGAWAQQSSSVGAFRYTGDVLASGHVEIAGITALNNLTRFPKIRYSKNIAGARAYCYPTEMTWQPAYSSQSARAVLPRLEFRSTRNYVVKFRPEDVARIVQ